MNSNLPPQPEILFGTVGCCQGGFRTRPYGASKSNHGQLIVPDKSNAPTIENVCLEVVGAGSKPAQ
jgi:hypothetical protein